MGWIPREPMTVDGFLRWQETRPETEHYELVNGEVVAMAPQTAAHAEVKARLWAALNRALTAASLPCRAYPDGMTVRIDENTAYEPDALVHCGPRVRADSLEIPDPVIVCEVLSPTTRGRDAGVKLADYFRLPSIGHYLIVEATLARVIHHRRRPDGVIETGVVTSGTLDLDPPGLRLEIADIYASVLA